MDAAEPADDGDNRSAKSQRINANIMEKRAKELSDRLNRLSGLGAGGRSGQRWNAVAPWYKN
jgi:hypothetical protein